MSSDSEKQWRRELRTVKRILCLDNIFKQLPRHDSLEKTKDIFWRECNSECDAWELICKHARSFRTQRNLCWALYKMIEYRYLDFSFPEDNGGFRKCFRRFPSEPDEIPRDRFRLMIRLKPVQYENPDACIDDPDDSQVLEGPADNGSPVGQEQGQIDSTKCVAGSAASPPLREMRPDGLRPIEGDSSAGWFDYNGKSVRLTRQMWALIQVLWNPDPTVSILVSVLMRNRSLWTNRKKSASATTPKDEKSKLRRALNRLNNQLRALKIRWSQEGKSIVRLELQ